MGCETRKPGTSAPRFLALCAHFKHLLLYYHLSKWDKNIITKVSNRSSTYFYYQHLNVHLFGQFLFNFLFVNVIPFCKKNKVVLFYLLKLPNTFGLYLIWQQNEVRFHRTTENPLLDVFPSAVICRRTNRIVPARCLPTFGLRVDTCLAVCLSVIRLSGQ